MNLPLVVSRFNLQRDQPRQAQWKDEWPGDQAQYMGAKPPDDTDLKT